jgi:Domain of unknown function (DUF1924)
MNSSTTFRRAAPALALVLPLAVAHAVTPREQLATFSAEAGRAASPARGQQFFTSRHGHEWSCATCHGERPTTPGRHASTGRSIEPMAPAVNPERFADRARTQKWFRRNCRDVIGRACSAAEKADVLAWLLSLEP